MIQKLPAVHCCRSICPTEEWFLPWWPRWCFSSSAFSAPVDAGALSAAEKKMWSNVDVQRSNVLLRLFVHRDEGEISYCFTVFLFGVDHVLGEGFPLILRNLKSLPQLLDLGAETWTKVFVLSLARLQLKETQNQRIHVVQKNPSRLQISKGLFQKPRPDWGEV